MSEEKKITEADVENYRSLGNAIVKMVELLKMPNASPADFRKVINVLYSCSKAIGGKIEENVAVMIDALLDFLNNPSEEGMLAVQLAITNLKQALYEL